MFETRKPRSVMDALQLYGHDEDFQPTVDETFQPTDATPGSSFKIELMRRRVELGQPLFHPRDNRLYFVTGAVTGQVPRSSPLSYRKNCSE